MRWPMPSMSMTTFGGSFFAGGFLLPPAGLAAGLSSAFFSPSAGFSSVTFSSSLSGASGDGSVFFSTAT